MISRLILGTVQFGIKYGINNQGDLMPTSEVNKILKLAANKGIKIIDTAADYGISEKRIGDFLQGSKQFKLITKLSKKENVQWKESLSQSLKNLQITQLDTLMFHSFQAYRDSKSTLQPFLEEGKNKWFKRIGISTYTNEELEAVRDDEQIEVVQTPFNLLDNSFQREDYLLKLKKVGKTIHTRSVFLQGLFFIDPPKLPAKLASLKSYCEVIHAIAKKENIEIGHLALQYVLSKEYIDGVLIGVDTVEQLKVNVQWVKNPISSSILKQIDLIKVSDTTYLNPSKW